MGAKARIWKSRPGRWNLPPHFRQAFNRGKREGFFLKSVENAPLAKRRKQKLRSAATSRRVSPVPAVPGRAPAAKGAPRRANGPLPPS